MYPFLIVGTGVLISPIVYFVFEMFAANSRMFLDLKSAIQIIWLIGFGALFSVPTLVVSFFLFRVIAFTLNTNTIWKKGLCVSIVQIGLVLTFYFVTHGNVFRRFDPLTAIYALTITVAGFYFDLEVCNYENAVSK